MSFSFLEKAYFVLSESPSKSSWSLLLNEEPKLKTGMRQPPRQSPIWKEAGGAPGLPLGSVLPVHTAAGLSLQLTSPVAWCPLGARQGYHQSLADSPSRAGPGQPQVIGCWTQIHHLMNRPLFPRGGCWQDRMTCACYVRGPC